MSDGRLLVPMINRHQRTSSSLLGGLSLGSGETLQTVVSYTRGNDLSGTPQGAGGIGGLLARTDHSTFNPQPSTAFYHADGNGNVTCLVDERNSVVARYIYDPYGNITASQGSLADANLYRFSSKEFHPQSELVYYLYRYYEPNLQRWLNRDPILDWGFEELLSEPGWLGSADLDGAGRNLYSFVRNTPVNLIDPLGLVPPGQGITIPPQVPNSTELTAAINHYNNSIKCGETPSDDDCLTICDAFYGNVAPTLVANCALACGDGGLGKFMGKNPIKEKKPKKPTKKPQKTK